MLNKIKFLFIISLLFIPSAFADLSANSSAAETQLAGLLQKFQSMQGSFTQTTYNSGGKQTQQSVGTMALQRPGKFRWETTSPNHQLIIADGQFVWVYDKALQQATKQKINGSESANPASLLSGDVQLLQQRFNVSPVNQGNANAFQLTPKTPSDLFQSIQLVFLNDLLQQMKITDNLGQTTVFQFSNLKINQNLSTNLFTFNPPRGVDVVPE